MISLEQEVREYFHKHNIPFEDNSRSYHLLDFAFGDRSAKKYFSFDVKEKCEPYKLNNWPETKIPEKHLFILDDLAARKILAFAPNSGLLVRDNTSHEYYLFTVVNLFLMPKIRINRKIRKNIPAYKGKWLIDFRNGHLADKLTALFDHIERYFEERKNIFINILECYGKFFGENIDEGGIIRQPKHWDIDINRTR